MKHVWVVILVVFSIFLGSETNAGQIDRSHYFIGLWQGIDPTDGSEVLRSVTKNQDGTFTIIGNETHFIGCQGDRGKVLGTGVLDGGVIVSQDFRLICFGEDYFDDSDDTVYSAPMEIVPDRRNRTIVEMYGNEAFNAAVLHRVSRP
jgi:hypothetical protein